MNISLQKLLTLAGIIAISIFSFAAKKAEPVNGECPFSGKAVKADKVLTFNVCCNNCVKKASSDIILAGHTHTPFYSPVDSSVFINPGSVGRPEGNDCRASYAIIELSSGQSTVKFNKIDYDVDRVLRALHATDLPDELSIVYKTGKNLENVRK